MATVIRNWLDVADDFQDTLVLGNGASISIHSSFGYKSLLQKAREENPIINTLDGLFEKMESDDFELALHHVSIAEYVNKALDIKDGKTHKAYQDIRNALIQTVRKIHPEHESVKHRMKAAYEFMKQFKTVASLNYDLLAYWAILEGNNALGNHFKDCFTGGDGRFTDKWKSLRQAHNAEGATLVFYPHGNLALAVDPQSREFKIASTNGTPLLDKILDTWKDRLCTPIFVAEGNSEQKLTAIRRYGYLTTVYDDVLPNLDGSVAIYGWSLDDNDKHLLERICKDTSKIAISVHGNGRRNGDTQSWCESVSQKIHKINDKAQIEFYDAESPGCWIHSSEVPAIAATP